RPRAVAIEDHDLRLGERAALLAPLPRLAPGAGDHLLGARGGDALDVDAGAVLAGARARRLPGQFPQAEVRAHLAVDAPLVAPLRQVAPQVIAEGVRAPVLLVDLRHLEGDGRRVARHAGAIEPHERLHVVDRLGRLAEADAKGRGVPQRAGRLRLARELPGEGLIALRGLRIERQLVIAGGHAVERLAGQGILGVIVDDVLPGLHR